MQSALIYSLGCSVLSDPLLSLSPSHASLLPRDLTAQAHSVFAADLVDPRGWAGSLQPFLAKLVKHMLLSLFYVLGAEILEV